MERLQKERGEVDAAVRIEPERLVWANGWSRNQSCTTRLDGVVGKEEEEEESKELTDIPRHVHLEKGKYRPYLYLPFLPKVPKVGSFPNLWCPMSSIAMSAPSSNVQGKCWIGCRGKKERLTAPRSASRPTDNSACSLWTPALAAFPSSGHVPQTRGAAGRFQPGKCHP